MASARLFTVSLLSLSVAGLPCAPSSTAPVDPGVGRSSTPPAVDGPVREMGTFGTLPPAVADVRMPDTLASQDVRGGNQQALQVLAGGAAGVAAVWRDHRDGMMGLYLRRFGTDGAPLDVDRPIHSAHSGRRRDPAAAIGPNGAGAVAWVSVAGAKNTVFLRAFDEGGRFTIPDLALEAPPDARAAEPGARVREGGDREPALAVLPDGRVVVAWNSNGSVVAQEFDARGKPLARARVLGGRNDPPAGAPRLVALEHAALCAWRPRERGPATAQLVAEDARPVALGDGVLDALAPDARGGAWAALHDPAKPKELGLVRFDGRGALVRDESARLALDATPVNVALACGPSSVVAAIGFAAEAAPANARRGAAPVGARARLFVGADAAHLAPAADDPFADGAVRPADLSAARAGNRFVVAWTDERNGDPDVFLRTFDPTAAAGARLGALVRANSDEASADQGHARVAANGERAIVAWHDARDVAERIFVRRLAATGPDAAAFAGPELELPLDATRDAPGRPVRQLPEVALAADGSFAVAWRDLGGAGETLQLQLATASSEPVAPHATVDPGERTQGSMPCALVALPGARGYVLAWPRPGGSLWTRRVLPDGSFAGPPRRVGAAEGAEVANPALAVLDDGRLVCAWDVQTAARPPACSLRARFLAPDGEPVGAELAFEPSLFGQDWDPAVAPGPNGGFVMAWTAGAPNDPGRDVFARAFDARGHPDGPFLPISTVSNEQDWPCVFRLDDGTWTVAWEDDLSGHDQIYVRRILASRSELGPVRLVNETETRCVPDRVLPAVAAWRGGWLAAWGDRRRSLGWDVYLRAVGPRFDDARKR